MSSSRLFADPRAVIVADASAAINLNGTGVALDVIRAVLHPMVVTTEAVAELERGRMRGHEDADKLAALVDQEAVRIVSLGEVAAKIYEQLVSGPALETLDDGEAATIACALEIGGLVLIDERKALNICASRFPSLEVVSTTEVLLHPMIERALGSDARADALFGALRDARMRVPTDLIEAVVNAVGSERACQCTSLPKIVRERIG